MNSAFAASEQAAGAAAQGAGHAAGGMPQLDFATYPSQIVWLVVIVVALYFALSRISLPRIAEVVAERKSTIVGDLDLAKKAQAKAETLEAAQDQEIDKARRQAQIIVEEARETIRKETAAALEKSRADIAELTRESETEIADMRNKALADIANIASDAASELVVAILSGSGTTDSQLRKDTQALVAKRSAN